MATCEIAVIPPGVQSMVSIRRDEGVKEEGLDDGRVVVTPPGLRLHGEVFSSMAVRPDQQPDAPPPPSPPPSQWSPDSGAGG